VKQGYSNFGSRLNEIEAPFYSPESLLKSVHPLFHRTQESQNLPLHLFEGRDAAFDIDEIELKSVNNPPDVPKVLNNNIARLVSHKCQSNPTRLQMLCANHTASAPEMISISSLVIIAWRVRL